ncbi:MAG: hypothetical protein AB4042_08790 [Leptolyngbyaceae cyanobacterium]
MNEIGDYSQIAQPILIAPSGLDAIGPWFAGEAESFTNLLPVGNWNGISLND